jgi:azurin
MRVNVRLLGLGLMLVLAMVLAACGGGSAPAAGGSTGGDSSGPATLEVGSKGEDLAFDVTALSVSAGQAVTVVFKNNSVAQQHNWILVSGGESAAQAIAQAGMTAGAAANYLGADKANVVAESPLAEPNTTVEVSFTAPAAGTYLFICTVPGHYPLMQGTLTVN